MAIAPLSAEEQGLVTGGGIMPNGGEVLTPPAPSGGDMPNG